MGWDTRLSSISHLFLSLFAVLGGEIEHPEKNYNYAGQFYLSPPHGVTVGRPGEYLFSSPRRDGGTQNPVVKIQYKGSRYES